MGWHLSCNAKDKWLAVRREVQMWTCPGHKKRGADCLSLGSLPTLWLTLSLIIETYTHILVSCGCHNKLPKIWWLKTTEIYFLMILEARSLKSVSLVEIKKIARLLPSAGFRWESIPWLSQLLVAASIPWLVAISF